MLHNRRSLSIGSSHELDNGLTSSASGVSLGTDMHENIDTDETEQSLLEVKMLQKHIGIFEAKITKSDKILNKRTQEWAKMQDKVEANKIFEQDIFELDLLHN